METATIEVGGMTCNGCVASVTRVLNAVPGVTETKVTLVPGSATVVFDSARTNLDALKAAIEDAGYDARG
ncbi:MAG TPA: heavy-metal-associated domain-containing protein [Casimicrobiaceae bacterium]|jgi:copper chaperone CopZ|nr:heavy-metal-associated domain-containing protein [Casimicrobiaceae bacterium]